MCGIVDRFDFCTGSSAVRFSRTCRIRTGIAGQTTAANIGIALIHRRLNTLDMHLQNRDLSTDSTLAHTWFKFAQCTKLQQVSTCEIAFRELHCPFVELMNMLGYFADQDGASRWSSRLFAHVFYEQ